MTFQAYNKKINSILVGKWLKEMWHFNTVADCSGAIDTNHKMRCVWKRSKRKRRTNNDGIYKESRKCTDGFSHQQRWQHSARKQRKKNKQTSFSGSHHDFLTTASNHVISVISSWCNRATVTHSLQHSKSVPITQCLRDLWSSSIITRSNSESAPWPKPFTYFNPWKMIKNVSVEAIH